MIIVDLFMEGSGSATRRMASEANNREAIFAVEGTDVSEDTLSRLKTQFHIGAYLVNFVYIGMRQNLITALFL